MEICGQGSSESCTAIPEIVFPVVGSQEEDYQERLVAFMTNWQCGESVSTVPDVTFSFFIKREFSYVYAKNFDAGHVRITWKRAYLFRMICSSGVPSL